MLASLAIEAEVVERDAPRPEPDLQLRGAHLESVIGRKALRVLCRVVLLGPRAPYRVVLFGLRAPCRVVLLGPWAVLLGPSPHHATPHMTLACQALPSTTEPPTKLLQT